MAVKLFFSSGPLLKTKAWLNIITNSCGAWKQHIWHIGVKNIKTLIAQTNFFSVLVTKTALEPVKVSFHSRSQGPQGSQQACVCDAYWYGNMVRTHSAKFGEGLRYSQSNRTCSTFANTHEILGVVARYGNKKLRFAMILCFGGTVLVLLFYVRGIKMWHAQSRNPLQMLVGTSSAHFPYLRNKGSSQWRQLRPEWERQHRSGKNSPEVATPTCFKACDLLLKLTLKESHDCFAQNNALSWAPPTHAWNNCLLLGKPLPI